MRPFRLKCHRHFPDDAPPLILPPPAGADGASRAAVAALSPPPIRTYSGATDGQSSEGSIPESVQTPVFLYRSGCGNGAAAPSFAPFSVRRSRISRTIPAGMLLPVFFMTVSPLKLPSHTPAV